MKCNDCKKEIKEYKIKLWNNKMLKICYECWVNHMRR